MEKYELLYLLPAKYTEEELKQMSEKIGGIVTAAGATVVATHHLGRRKLAYPINNVRVGNYILSMFDAEQPVVAKLNEMLRLSPDVLRHFITVKDPAITKIPAFVEEETRRVHADEQPTRPPAPPIQQQPLQSKEKISMVDLDKKLDEILTEDIL